MTLHAFVSGLKKSLKVAVFPAQPRDLPIALSLAQEAESSNDRSVFAASFAKHNEEKLNKPNTQRPFGWRNPSQQNSYNYEQGQNLGAIPKIPISENPKGRKPTSEPVSLRQSRPYAGNTKSQPPPPEPMDFDSSSRCRQPTNWQRGQSTRTQQKINYLSEQRSEEEEYNQVEG